MSIAENLQQIQSQVGEDVQLIAISKTHPVATIKEAYQAGHRAFGENKVQELVAKAPELPKDIQWHMVGHLQTNKVKYIAPFVHLIHSVDRLKLLRTINKEAQKANRVIDCLLQLHIAKEESKFGLSLEQAVELLTNKDVETFQHVRIRGVMGMATFTDDQKQVAREFSQLQDIFTKLKNRFFEQDEAFSELSMGMSNDYPLAVAQGSTMVRVGTAVFGQRDYSQPAE